MWGAINNEGAGVMLYADGGAMVWEPEHSLGAGREPFLCHGKKGGGLFGPSARRDAGDGKAEANTHARF
jgi:hypothetical protein